MRFAKIDIRPTDHYITYHSDVTWDLVIKTILSPDKSHINKRKGKDRFTYIKYFNKYIIEIHTKNDILENKIWVINTIKMRG